MPRSTMAITAAAALAACTPASSNPTAVDFTLALRFENAQGCLFRPQAELAFAGLVIVEDWDRRKVIASRALSLGSTVLTPRLTTTRVQSYPGGMDYRGVATLPAGSRWHGLSLRRIENHTVILPEVDGLEERLLVFGDPPERVKGVLAGLGAAVPLAPASADLPSDASYAKDTCGGTMQIVAEGTGAALVCSRGC